MYSLSIFIGHMDNRTHRQTKLLMDNHKLSKSNFNIFLKYIVYLFRRILKLELDNLWLSIKSCFHLCVHFTVGDGRLIPPALVIKIISSPPALSRVSSRVGLFLFFWKFWKLQFTYFKMCIQGCQNSFEKIFDQNTKICRPVKYLLS